MIMNKILLLMLCSLIFLFGCAKRDVAVEVDNATISNKDFYIAYNTELIDSQIDSQDKNYTQKQLRLKAIRKLIIQKIANNKLEKYSATQDEIDELRNMYIKMEGSKEALEEKNKQSGMDEEIFKEYLIRKIKRKKILQDAGWYKVSDEQLKNFYNDNQHLYRTDESFDVSHILFKTNYSEIKNRYTENDKTNKMNPDQLDKIIYEEIQKNTEILNKVKKEVTVENFVQMAQKYSQDEKTAPIGGDLGTLQGEDMSPKFMQQLYSQEEGTISSPVYTKYGTHLIYLRKKTPYSLKPLEEVRDDATFRLLDYIEYDLFIKYIGYQMEYAKIVYNNKKLKPEYTSIWDKIQRFFAKLEKKEENNGASNKSN